ncbi:MAG: DUF488 domain-containing protein [Verrucomicrobiota bacterium]
MITLKRVYDPPSDDDGERILVDRLWPRGVKKAEARLSCWMKEVAPTPALREWFGHDPSRWEEFRRRYAEELRSPDKQALLKDIALKGRHGVVTLVFGARDPEHNHALVLKQVIGEIARKAA